MGQPTDPAERVGRQRAALPVRVDDLDDVVGPGRHQAPFGRRWIGGGFIRIHHVGRVRRGARRGRDTLRPAEMGSSDTV